MTKDTEGGMVTNPGKTVEDLVSAAENAFRAGQMKVVEQRCRQVLQLDLRHIHASHLLRLALNAQGDVEQELQVLRQILSLDPNHVESLNGLGDALRKQGQAAAGIEPCLQAIQLRPNYANAHNTLGLCYFEVGSLTMAAESFERAIMLSPTLAAAHVNLGATLRKLNRSVEAVECYKRAVQLAPGSSEAQEALGMLLLQQHRTQEATDCLKRVLRMNPGSARAHLLLADALQQQGMSDKAAELARKALAIDPTSGQAYCMLGLSTVDLGDFKQATSFFESSIALLPAQADAYLGLVTSKKVTESDRALVDQMLALLEAPEISPTDLAQLHSVLGKAFDDLGEYELAMSHVDAGNRIAQGLEGQSRPEGSREAASAYVEKTIQTFTADYYRKHAQVGLETESPIFIVGLPRSGTTLLEQVLSSHSQVTAGGEIRYWDDIGVRTPGRLIGLAANRDAVRSAAQEYVRGTRLAEPQTRFVTDKFNDNFFNLGLLHLAFPNARVIHCRRSPIDNCLSLYLTPFRRKNPLFRSREEILGYYGHYLQLMNHWRDVLPADRFIEVDYEEMIANHEEVTRRIVAFCDLEWEDSCLRHEDNKRVINTPSKWQARQPIYKTSVERWKRYEPWLGAFRQLVQSSTDEAAECR